MKKKIITLTGILANNFWLKLIALIIAVLLWYYANGQAEQGYLR